MSSLSSMGGDVKRRLEALAARFNRNQAMQGSIGGGAASGASSGPNAASTARASWLQRMGVGGGGAYASVPLGDHAGEDGHTGGREIDTAPLTSASGQQPQRAGGSSVLTSGGNKAGAGPGVAEIELSAFVAGGTTAPKPSSAKPRSGSGAAAIPTLAPPPGGASMTRSGSASAARSAPPVGIFAIDDDDESETARVLNKRVVI